MQKVKLKEWPYKKDKVAKLLWIKSPYKDEKRDWMLNLCFKSEDEIIADIKAPWGSLPWLRFGQNFMNGTPLEALRDGTLVTLEIANPSGGTLFNPVFLPDELLKCYSGISIEKEYLWCFKSGKYTIYVPCIELVRAFLVPNVTLAKALLEPYGMKFVIQSTEKYKDGINIYLDRQVPKEIITPAFIKHLAWLYYDDMAKELWNSVLNSVFPDGAIADSNPTLFDDRYLTQKHNTIAAWPPIKNKSIWDVRALQGDGFIYIFEIIGINGLDVPFEKITYQHDLIVQRKRGKVHRIEGYTKPPRKKRVKEKIVLTEQSPRTIVKPKVIQTLGTTMGFNKNILVLPHKKTEEIPVFEETKKMGKAKQQRRLLEIKMHQEKLKREQDEKKGNGFVYTMVNEQPKKLTVIKKSSLFSTAEEDFSIESNIRPIEFKGIRAAESQAKNGLEDFLNMIKILGTLHKDLQVLDIKIMNLPYGNGFSMKEDGTIRRFAIVTVEFREITVYILEVERLKRIYLSTLIILPKSGKALSNKELSVVLEELLFRLIKNYGHWDKSQFINKEVIIKPVKHFNTWNFHNWASLMLHNIDVDIFI